MLKHRGLVWGLRVVACVLGLSSLCSSGTAFAYISQVDGTLVPQTTRMQQCLDRPVSGESSVGAVNALAEAAVVPEAFRPVLDSGSGHYRVTVMDIGEGAGYRNTFGWFWIGTDITDPANLHTIFGCRTYGTCSCPCATTRTITVDFDMQAGFSVGRPIGFWLRSPERLDGSSENGAFDGSACPMDVGCDVVGTNVNDSCGGRNDTNNRIYFTSKALNDDGDYLHFLVYRSATHVNTFYFGFEDLFRGGDNDFEDMLTRASGLVPLCDPQPETCNNVDDDCDGVIDDGITTPCSNACGMGTRTCAAGAFGTCNAPTPSPEACNNLDDDCNGSADDGLSRACSNSCGSGTEICVAGGWIGCSARTPSIEICDNIDNDCNGSTDEGLSRACATDCGSGTEICSAGAWTGCTATVPGTEVCNGLDDDCDGLTDEGLSRACSSACGSGSEVCVSGEWVGCTAPGAVTETCNNLDDDCDGTIDDGLTRSCSTSCGVGTETCVGGTWRDCTGPAPGTEICNNMDDDCDGVIDDGNPGGGGGCLPTGDGGYATVDLDGGVPAGDGGICAAGRLRCTAGVLSCEGASSPRREICNCEDDNCDGNVDEDPDNTLCPGGACISCACASPCNGTEFPCPRDKICDTSYADPENGILIGLCVSGLCAGVSCTDQEICDPNNGLCRNVCNSITCPGGEACVRGLCVEDNCYGRGCPTGERCVAAVCEADPCFNTDCGINNFCRDGVCHPACQSRCEGTEVCQDGTCVDSPCDPACTAGAACVDGTCVSTTDCSPRCLAGRTCQDGTCVDDVCDQITCGLGYVCENGSCTVPAPPAAPPPYRAIASGGGGCACSAAGASESTSGAPFFLSLAFAFGVLAWRRRKALNVRKLGVVAAVLAAFLTSGCDVDPFCFNCGEVDGGVDAGRDMNTYDSHIDPRDGCVPTSETETCNGLDDDCNGLIDDGFNLQTNPDHCGACGRACGLPFTFPSCVSGECVVETCELGHVDHNGLAIDGCEYECLNSGNEICDTLDNDCDTQTDEGFMLDNDVENCGACGRVCSFANATVLCTAGVCHKDECIGGYEDANAIEADGCEYRCTPTGIELCDGIDNNCEGQIDEDFDLLTDTLNCGLCGRTCSFLHAGSACSGGICVPTTCMPGFLDLDGSPGCEYACTVTNAIDSCNRLDDDCNGTVDDEDPMVGMPCGTTTGACEAGTNTCQGGSIVCVGALGATSEVCNGIDDDCDSMTDEGSLPGVGARCGATNAGACEYGMVACSAGSLSCGGALVTAGSETCNGVDDNCDGTIDNAPSAPTTTPASCTEVRGVCAGRTPVCQGATGWNCTLPITYQATETICDTLNNDCDGSTDEGCITVAGASDTRLDTMDAAGSWNSITPFILGDGANRVYVSWMDMNDGAGAATCCNSGGGCGAVVACGGSRVCVGTSCLQNAQAFFTRSTNNGAAWDTPIRMNTGTGAAIAPILGVTTSGEDIAAAWADFRGGSYRQIWTRLDTNFGAAFSAGEVRGNSGQALDSFNTAIATASNKVYVVYETFTTSRERHVFLVRSTDNGATWSAPLQVDHGTGTDFVAATPRVAAIGNNVYVTWRDNRNGSLDVFVNRSTNSGAAFAASDTRLDVGTIAGSSSSFNPVIGAEGTNVYVAWVDDRMAGSFDIWVNHSSDSGATWVTSSATRLDQDTFGHDSIDPQIVTPAAGVALVSWIDYRYGFPDILAARTGDAGGTWSVPARVDTGGAAGTSGSYDVAMGASSSLITIAWADDRSGYLDIYANFSLDGGVTWQPQDYRLDSSMVGSSDSQSPAVYVSGSRAHVVWIDNRSGSMADLYYRRMQ
ncbi:MAG: DUF4114 domain-containing protein [Sandaracinaceae bacterium]|nr:DUF4114 domain-containing protein [Sandaracinaceae bacterium]